MAADYRFVTTWRLRAPIDAVWQAIYASEQWPSWWRGVLRVTPRSAADANGLGGRATFVWKSRLPYTLAFDMTVTRVEPPHHLEGAASGELEGSGAWELTEAGGITTVVYTWAVHTTRPWMNLLAPIARPIFAWNHDYVMRQGGEDLARLLHAELLPA